MYWKASSHSLHLITSLMWDNPFKILKFSFKLCIFLSSHSLPPLLLLYEKPNYWTSLASSLLTILLPCQQKMSKFKRSNGGHLPINDDRVWGCFVPVSTALLVAAPTVIRRRKIDERITKIDMELGTKEKNTFAYDGQLRGHLPTLPSNHRGNSRPLTPPCKLTLHMCVCDEE